MEVYFTSDSIKQHIDMGGIHHFSPESMLSEHRWEINNRCMAARFEDISCDDFKIFKTQMRSSEDCKIETLSSDHSFVCLVVPMVGDVNYHYNRINDSGHDNNWTKGFANILVSSQSDGHSNLRKDNNFEMLEILISTSYFEKISMVYPHLFEDSYKRLKNGESFFLAPENIPITPLQYQLFRDILSLNNMGNVAKMYGEAKVMESLALFMHGIEKQQTERQHSLSSTDRECMHQVREIIHQQYKTPPTLLQIALLVGINEHKLKKAFKQEFGTTVFGYLFDYRMSLAYQYLKDSNRTIQEIAESVGYEHQSHFSTAFKRKYKISPREMRIN